VTPFYDPILSKLVVWGEDREIARIRAVQALSDYVILGIRTPTEFLRDILSHPHFIEGRTHTDFIEKHMSGWSSQSSQESIDLAVLASAAHAYSSSPKPGSPNEYEAKLPTPWHTLGAWRSGQGRR
jgi:acetyl/propionyl-CoA carboxylase alpha subunit